MKTKKQNSRNLLIRAVLTLVLAAGVVTTNTGCDDDFMEAFATGFEFGYNNPELVLGGVFGPEELEF